MKFKSQLKQAIKQFNNLTLPDCKKISAGYYNQ